MVLKYNDYLMFHGSHGSFSSLNNYVLFYYNLVFRFRPEEEQI